MSYKAEPKTWPGPQGRTSYPGRKTTAGLDLGHNHEAPNCHRNQTGNVPRSPVTPASPAPSQPGGSSAWHTDTIPMGKPTPVDTNSTINPEQGKQNLQKSVTQH